MEKADKVESQITHIENSRFAQSPELKTTLIPEVFTDTDGVERQLYTLYDTNNHPVNIVFYSPEEIPYSQDIIKNKNTMILGEKPRYRSIEDWQNFNDQLYKESSSFNQNNVAGLQKERVFESGNGLIFVESNPTALLDLAVLLGAKTDQEYQINRRSAHLKIITEKVQDMIDKIIASKIYDTNGEKRSEVSYEGELLTILTLMGNMEAQTLLEQSYQVLQKSDATITRARQEEIKEWGEKNKDAERIEIGELIAVHATRYLPKKHKGKKIIKSTFDATGWEVPRNTVHSALNHHVSGHSYGSWDETPYVIMTPLADMIKDNGNPALLNTVDTYFEVSPGTGLKLPETTWIVRPGSLNEGEIITYNEVNQEVRYKTDRLRPADLKMLCSYYDDRQRVTFNNELFREITSLFGTVVSDRYVHISEEQSKRIFEISSSRERINDIAEIFFSLNAKESIANICRELFMIDITDEDIDRIAKNINTFFTTQIKELAVNSQMEKMGFAKKQGGMWAWGGSWDVTSSTTKLGAEIGVPVGAHSGTTSYAIEGFVPKKFSGLDSKNNRDSLGDLIPPEKPAIIKHEVREYLMTNIDKLSPELRRAVYLMGAI